MMCFKVELLIDGVSQGSYIEECKENLGDFGSDAEVGDVYRVTVCDMTREEIDALPEFTGF